MSEKEHLQVFRDNLVDRLATLVYRDTSATSEERISEIARLKAAVDAVDFIIANDIPEPPPPDPKFMVI
ncbi:hypothetical protein [Paracoccus binzhouensis]|uniref:hypothetical protein n=1 Tax=Paracoccus binzhouensis TaxID=2796149 RepID=UPI0018EEEF3B|nr:hypothetical protein [Paracoccus binzhouensis]